MFVARLALTLLLASSCSPALLSHDVMFVMPESGIHVRGNVIYCHDKPFAELRYFDTVETSNVPDSHRGLAIYYYTYNKEVWIFPKEGWSIRVGDRYYREVHDISRIWTELRGKRLSLAKESDLLLGGKPPTKEEILTVRAYDVHISEDGRYVYYRTQGMLKGSTHRYFVEYGMSE